MRLRSVVVGLSAVTALAMGCSTEVEDAASAGDALAVDPVCQHMAAYPNTPLANVLRASGAANEVLAGDVPLINNFTAWPAYDPNSQTGAYDANIVKAKTDPEEARTNIASTFGDCAPKVKQHLAANEPNVYIYFTGFGGATQNNSLVDDGAIMRWINKRDPKALIFSINWSCADSHDAFCEENAVKLRSGEASPEYRKMTETVNAVAPQAMGTVQQILAATDANQAGYNTALSHAMQLSALLVDQLLVADKGPNNRSLIGNIHFLGYSMGAHAAAQVLVQDFLGNGAGFKWTRPNVCDTPGDTCTVAHLRKVKWSLALGLSGWSEALLAYDGARADRAAADQYKNGGLLRIQDARFNGKANVFNRRMDPTGNSGDTFQRGFGDIFFSDYNHYSHDYSMPLFVNPSFVRTLDAFLESPVSKSSQEMGVIFDNAGHIDFDDCPEQGACKASTGYLAHAVNRAHDELTLVHTGSIATTDGVKHPERANSRAVTFTAAGAQPIVVNTFDQEDLRGGVELYFRPQFDTASAGTRGLFSYGSCGASQDDLMPQAFVKDGQLQFAMRYQGRDFSASVPVSAAKLAEGKWTHLAFTWELPVVSLASLQSPTFREDVGRYGQALVLATGLRKPLPTTYNRQKGEGKLRIFANGNEVAVAPLGTPESQRDCLDAADVLSSRPYDVDGQQYPAFVPYARYDAVNGDAVSIGGPPIGAKCKAYKVRNERAFFGCAQGDAVNAQGDMDDITLVWGPGRTSYENVDKQTGAPKAWQIGARVNATPYQAR